MGLIGQSNRPHSPRRWVRFVAGPAVLLGFTVLLAVLFIGPILAASDSAPHADAIVILAGEDGTRIEHGVALWRQGVAPVLVLTLACEPAGRYRSRLDRVFETLRGAGVPAESVRVAGVDGRCVQNTRGEAQAIRELAVQADWTRVLVVTSWYHSRRAELIIRRETRDLGLAVYAAAAPSWRYGANDWWRYRTGWRVVAVESAKLALALFGYER